MKKQLAFVLLSLSFLIIQEGCIVYDPVAGFIKQRYTNGVAYFNTFYNAQRAFSEAEDDVMSSRKDFQEKSIPGATFSISQSARTKFNTSIEKNSKILTFYPTSKWVDDALLMIGKAYSYMGDDVKAERKYLELFAKYPESDLIPEAHLWYGKGLLNQNKVDQGVKQLEDLFEQTKSFNADIAGQSAFSLAEYFFQSQQYDQALLYYKSSIDYVPGGDKRAMVYFQMGECSDRLNNFSQAEASYAKAADEADSYALVFRSRFSEIREIARQKRYDDAFARLNDMLRDSKNVEYNSKINYEIGNILYDQGKISDALTQYGFVDTTYAKTDESARSLYKQGLIYNNVLVNYDSARVYFNKAKSEFPSSEITADAVKKASTFNKYKDLTDNLSRYDSTYRSIEYDLFKIDSTDVQEKITPSFMAQKSITDTSHLPLSGEALSSRERDSIAAADSVRQQALKSTIKEKRALADSMHRSIVRTKFELAGLFFLDMQQPDSALFWYNDIVQHHDQSSFAPRSLYSIAEILRVDKQAPKEVLDSLYQKLVSLYPKSLYAQEARKYLGLPPVQVEPDTIKELYEKAELLAEDQHIEQAVRRLENLAKNQSSSPIIPKAMYAAGWYYENSLENNDSAIAIYKRLIRQYPSSQFAAAVRGKVNEYDAEMKRIEDEKQKEIEKQKELKKQKEIEQQQSSSNGPSIQKDTVNIPIQQPSRAARDSLKREP